MARQTADGDAQGTTGRDVYSAAAEFSEAEEALSGEEEAAVSDADDEDGEDLMATGGFVADELEEDQDEPNEYDASMLDDEGEYGDLTAAQREAAEAAIARRHRNSEATRTASGGLRSVAALFRGLGAGEAVDEAEAETQEEEDQAEMVEEQEAVFRGLRGRRVRVHRPEEGVVLQARQALPECNSSSVVDERIRSLLNAVIEGFIWYDVPEDVNPGTESEGTPYYLGRMEDMVRAERKSLIVDWAHLAAYEPKLLDWIVLRPQELFGIMDDVATSIVRALYPSLYELELISVRVSGRHRGGALQTIRSLKTSSINSLICIEGVCVRRTDVLPKLKTRYYRCIKCGFDGNGPFSDNDLSSSSNRASEGVSSSPLVVVCIECQSTGPFSLCRERTVFENYQKVTIQEVTSSIPPGHIPRQKTLVLLGDLVDTVRPGDEVVVSGIMETNQDSYVNAKLAFPVFGVWIVANYIQRRREKQMEEMTEKDIGMIRRLGKHPRIRDKLIKSIAPSIWGHVHAKTAIALAMFGGVRHEGGSGPAGHSVRGDINVLIVGDPGMGKSQLLKFVAHCYPRTVLTTGKGASGVGLTASVKRDHVTGEWVLEGGAFVLADEGICLIDEFDKMSDHDRVSIHEAMEQQSISLSKAGIIATLRARCAVIAAANPIGGQYATSLTLPENLELSDPILSRFDVVAVMKDEVYPLSDQYLADHVLLNHIQAHPDAAATGEVSNVEQPDDTIINGYPAWVTNDQGIPDRYLRQYILYARQYIRPLLKATDEQRIVDFYTKMRQATYRFHGSMPMTVRHLESIFRMAAANAKMRLSNVISTQDIDYSMSTMFESFVESQKHSVAQAMSQTFAKYRALAASPHEVLHGILKNIISRSLDDQYCTKLLQQIDEESVVEVPLHEFKQLAHNIHQLPENFVDAWINNPKFTSIYYLTQRQGQTFIGCKVS